jgi:Ca-activated chloride channel family protein
MLQAMGSTNLSSGLFEGVNQVESFFLEEGINRVILLSDGLANKGVVSRPELERYAAKAGDKGVSLSTIGVGWDFNEELMMAIASAGRGNYYYVGDPETIPSVFMREMEGLASVVAQNITLTLSLNRGIEVADVLGFPREKAEGKVRIRLGDMASGGRSLVGFKLRLVQEPEKEGLLEMGSLSIGYNSVGGEIGRVKDLVPLRIEFARERSRVEEGENRRVDRYLKLLTVVDVMTLAMESGDPGAALEAMRGIESELESFLQWTRTVDDPEAAFLGSIFKDCLSEMRKGMANPGSGMAQSNRDAGKEIRYKLYRLRRQAGR